LRFNPLYVFLGRGGCLFFFRRSRAKIFPLPVFYLTFKVGRDLPFPFLRKKSARSVFFTFGKLLRCLGFFHTSLFPSRRLTEVLGSFSPPPAPPPISYFSLSRVFAVLSFFLHWVLANPSLSLFSLKVYGGSSPCPGIQFFFQ